MERAWQDCRTNTQAALQQIRSAGNMGEASGTSTGPVETEKSWLPKDVKKRSNGFKRKVGSSVENHADQNQAVANQAVANQVVANQAPTVQDARSTAANDWASQLDDLKQLAHDVITTPIVNAIITACAQKPTENVQTPVVPEVPTSVPSAPHKFAARLFQNTQDVPQGPLITPKRVVDAIGMRNTSAQGVGSGVVVVEGGGKTDAGARDGNTDGGGGGGTKIGGVEEENGIADSVTQAKDGNEHALGMCNTGAQGVGSGVVVVEGGGKTDAGARDGNTDGGGGGGTKIGGVEEENGIADSVTQAKDGNEVIVVSSESCVIIESTCREQLKPSEFASTAVVSEAKADESATIEQNGDTNDALLAFEISSSLPAQKETVSDETSDQGPTTFTKETVEDAVMAHSEFRSSSNESPGPSQKKSYTENDAKQLDYTMKLPLPKEMVSVVRSYLSKPKMPVMSSTLKDGSSQVLSKLRGGVMIGPPPCSPVREEDGDTNDAFREVNESFMEHSFNDEQNDEQYCPYEVIFDNHAKGRRSFNHTVAQKIYDNNPLMRFESEIAGVYCLRLTVGSMVWVDQAFSEHNLATFIPAALDASEPKTALLKKLEAFVTQMITDFYKPFPAPVDVAYAPSGGKGSKRKRVKDLPLDHRAPFDHILSVALKQFCFDHVPVLDVHTVIADVMRILQKKLSNGVRTGRLNLLGIDPKSAAADVDF